VRLFAISVCGEKVGIVKPPRSKYCKLTQAHVARFDHFCPWLNQAVGAENYRWFLAFLLGHCLLLLYGALGMVRAFCFVTHNEKKGWHVRDFSATLVSRPMT